MRNNADSFQCASLLARFLAFSLDVFFLGVLILIADYFFIKLVREFGLLQIYGITLFCLYFGVFEIVGTGGTFGKRILGIKITKLNGSQPGMVLIIFRAILKIFSISILIGVFPAFFTKRKQCIHDLVCNTMVVNRF